MQIKKIIFIKSHQSLLQKSMVLILRSSHLSTSLYMYTLFSTIPNMKSSGQSVCGPRAPTYIYRLDNCVLYFFVSWLLCLVKYNKPVLAFHVPKQTSIHQAISCTFVSNIAIDWYKMCVCGRGRGREWDKERESKGEQMADKRNGCIISEPQWKQCGCRWKEE